MRHNVLSLFILEWDAYFIGTDTELQVAQIYLVLRLEVAQLLDTILHIFPVCRTSAYKFHTLYRISPACLLFHGF